MFVFVCAAAHLVVVRIYAQDACNAMCDVMLSSVCGALFSPIWKSVKCISIMTLFGMLEPWAAAGQHHAKTAVSTLEPACFT